MREMKNKMNCSGGPSGAVYGMGFIGALVYFWQHSATFPDYLLGFLRALAWPAFLIHKIYSLLGM